MTVKDFGDLIPSIVGLVFIFTVCAAALVTLGWVIAYMSSKPK
jgi:hypothetical protein